MPEHEIRIVRIEPVVAPLTLEESLMQQELFSNYATYDIAMTQSARQHALYGTTQYIFDQIHKRYLLDSFERLYRLEADRNEFNALMQEEKQNKGKPLKEALYEIVIGNSQDVHTLQRFELIDMKETESGTVLTVHSLTQGIDVADIRTTTLDRFGRNSLSSPPQRSPYRWRNSAELPTIERFILPPEGQIWIVGIDPNKAPATCE
ncbi:MAG TPA: hypothetical protein VGT05_00545 [Patescibacteria group bacterium]|nr:hypothetical protein [Patescibacteria group bacterium]